MCKHNLKYKYKYIYIYIYTFEQPKKVKIFGFDSTIVTSVFSTTNNNALSTVLEISRQLT